MRPGAELDHHSRSHTEEVFGRGVFPRGCTDDLSVCVECETISLNRNAWAVAVRSVQAQAVEDQTRGSSLISTVRVPIRMNTVVLHRHQIAKTQNK